MHAPREIPLYEGVVEPEASQSGRPAIQPDDGPTLLRGASLLLADSDLFLAVLPLHHGRVPLHLDPHRLAIAERVHLDVLTCFAADSGFAKYDHSVAVGNEPVGRDGRGFLAQSP